MSNVLEGVAQCQKNDPSPFPIPHSPFPEIPQLISGTTPRLARRGASREDSIGMSRRGSNISRQPRSFELVAALTSRWTSIAPVDEMVIRRTTSVPNGNTHARSFVMENQSRAAPRRIHFSRTTAFVGIEKSCRAFVVTDSIANSPTAADVSLVPVAPSPSC